MTSTSLNCCNILSFGFDALSGPLIPCFLVITNLLHSSDSSKIFFLFQSFHNSYLTHPPNPSYNRRSALLPLLSKGLGHTSSSDLLFPASQVTSRKKSLHQNLKSHHGAYIQNKPVVHTVVLEKDETVLKICTICLDFIFLYPMKVGGNFINHRPVLVCILNWKVSGKWAVIYDIPLQMNKTLIEKIQHNCRFFIALSWFDHAYYYQAISLSCTWIQHKVLNTDHITK